MREAPVTDVTLERLLPLVKLRVGQQIALAGEALLTDCALDGLLACLTLFVATQVLFAREGSLADFAGVHKWTRVAFPVQVELRFAGEALWAEVARVGDPPGVPSLVGVPLLFGGEVLPAEAAEVGYLVGGLHCVEDEAGVLRAAFSRGQSEGECFFHVDPLMILGILPAVGRESTVGAAVKLLVPSRWLHGVLNPPVSVGALFFEEELAARLTRGTHFSKVDLDL